MQTVLLRQDVYQLFDRVVNTMNRWAGIIETAIGVAKVAILMVRFLFIGR